MKENYYARSLNAERLRQVYDTAIERVARYLECEISFVCGGLKKSDEVLELAAGYGRVVKKVAPFVRSVTGLDISEENVRFGAEYLKDTKNAELLVMDVHEMDYDRRFDVALCLQNGLSAVRAEAPELLTAKVLKALKMGGKAYFSTYHPRFWEHRLAWFKEQAEKGLLGELDMEKCKDGVLVCKDGFRATTQSAEDLERIGCASGYRWQISEVDDSSLFLVIEKII